MKERFAKFVTRKRLWFGLLILMILALNVIGHMRMENSIQDIFGSGLPETLLNFVLTLIQFPSGIYTLVLYIGALVHPPVLPHMSDAAQAALSTGELVNIAHRRLLFIPWATIFYPAFLFAVAYISNQEQRRNLAAWCLFMFMLLSFIGSALVVRLSLVPF